MTEPYKNTPKGTDGVHRLVEMLVEEVSIVDRAANKHQFLIVKRDDSMNEDANENGTHKSEDSPLAIAIDALERLTDLVELLDSMGKDEHDTNLTEIAQRLQAIADQILQANGTNSESVEDRSKAEESQQSTTATPTTATTPTAPPAATTSQSSSSPSSAEEHSSIAQSISNLAASFNALVETVKEQQQRLGRVEKQFGLPNSVASVEQVTKTTIEEVGWPLDLNKPLDRANVDKSTSFHDI